MGKLTDKGLRMKVYNTLRGMEAFKDKPTGEFAHKVMVWGEKNEAYLFLGFMREGALHRASMRIADVDNKEIFAPEV